MNNRLPVVAARKYKMTTEEIKGKKAQLKTIVKNYEAQLDIPEGEAEHKAPNPDAADVTNGETLGSTEVLFAALYLGISDTQIIL